MTSQTQRHSNLNRIIFNGTGNERVKKKKTRLTIPEMREEKEETTRGNFSRVVLNEARSLFG